LYQNYPNPFSANTKIQFNVIEKCDVSLDIYSFQGERVSNIINKQYMPGNYNITFNGSKLPSGIYYCKFQAGEYADVKKMILLK